MKRLTLAALLAAILLSGACAPKDTHLPRAKASEITSDVAQFDSTFYEVFRHLTEELHALMVIKDGKVIYEKYSTGHTADELHVLWSATKTFTATAVGFARQDGLLDIDDPIVKYFREDEIPADRDPRIDSITIRHLLTMSSGIDDHNYNYEVSADGTVNPVLSCLSYPMGADPGQRWSYDNNDTNLLGIIVGRVTGMKMADYLDRKLFKPLGIRNYRWFEDPAGNNIGAYGLYMTAESIGKMTQFMLHKGVWNGRRLLGEDWFDMAMSEQIFQEKQLGRTDEEIAKMHRENDWGAGYGFQMWMCKDGRGCRLDGANGQFGIILPDKNTTVVMTSKCWDTLMEMTSFWKNVYDYL